jgi:ABC-type multidrug transport system fused ATPase/permease subunit
VAVFQKAKLFKGTIRSNLKWGDRSADDRALSQALAIAQASEIVGGRNGGLDATVEIGGRNFSGGQRQRLCIARALVAHPKLLILDDSTSALDYATDAALRGALNQLDCALVIISQRTLSVRDADQILVLDNGRQVGLGTHEELLESCGVYQEIYDSQYSDRREAAK